MHRASGDLSQRLRADPGGAFLVASLLVALVAAPAVFVPALYDDFTLPKQATLFVAAALGLLGLALRGMVLPGHRGLRLGVLAWIAMLFISWAAGIDPRGGLLGVYQYRQGFLTQAAYVVLFLAALAVARNGLPRWLAPAGLAGLLAVGAYTGIQALGLDPITWWLDTADRAIGTIGNANELAAAAIIGLAFAGIVPGPRRTRLLAAGATATLAGFIVLESESRSGLAALLGLLAAYPVAALVGRTPRGELLRFAGVLVAGVAAGACLSFLTGGVKGSATRVESGIAGEDPAASTRMALWKGTVATIAASPLTGFGPDGLALAFPRHRPADLGGAYETYDLVAQSSHNLALDTAANTGLPGLAALTAVLVTAAVLAVREQRRAPRPGVPLAWSAMAGYGALTLVNPVSLAPHAAFLVLLGALAAPAAAAARAPTRSFRMRPAARVVLAAPAAFALGAIAVLLPVADMLRDNGWDAAERGDFETAAGHYADASALLPFDRAYASAEAAAWLASAATTGDRQDLLRARAAYEQFDDRFGFYHTEAIAYATTLIGLGLPASRVLPEIDRAYGLNPHGAAMNAYTAHMRQAATGGATLHYSEKDHWVQVEFDPSAER